MNNGELTFKKAVKVVKGYDVPVSELQEYCEAVDFLETTIDDVIESMEWMVAQLKWQTKTIQNPDLSVLELANISDSQISYSPELHEAMDVLEKLKHG